MKARARENGESRMKITLFISMAETVFFLQAHQACTDST